MSDEDDYHSSDDDDYVPEAGVGDVEDEPSGDEVDEVTAEDGGIVSGSRRKKQKQTSSTTVVSEPSCSAEAKFDADALLSMLDDEDPLLSRYKSDKNDSSTMETSEATNSSPCSSSSGSNSSSGSTVENKIPSSSSVPQTATITEVFDFAGDEIKIEKEVSLEELRRHEEKERKAKEEPKKPQKRMGLTGALNLISKKPKISVLDKSNHDWDAYKKEHNITEELSTFNKGKDGYLTKMDFLNRTDFRQFEIEKSMRQSSRKQ